MRLTRIVTADSLLFLYFLLLLLPLYDRCSFLETSAIDLKLLTQCAEWPQFAFQHFRKLAKQLELFEMPDRHPSVTVNAVMTSLYLSEGGAG